jgi:hypothetical protein
MKARNLKVLDCAAFRGVARVVAMATKNRSKSFNQSSRGFAKYCWVFADVKRLRKPIK